MPTGYTAAVKDGISFEQFTWNCARAFGALIMMRDEPSDAKVPETFAPSDYYAQSLAAAFSRLNSLKAMPVAEAQASSIADHAAAIRRLAERVNEAQDLRNSYNEMLAKVIKWSPPTSEHESLKEFMAEQLRTSIEFDCNTDHLITPLQLDGPTWLAKAIANAEEDIARYSRLQEEEIARTQQRNDWIAALRASVPPSAA